MSALVFLDTECTGLSWDDEIWEIAAVRREPDGAESQFHTFVNHDIKLCAELPEPFQTDHRNRYDYDAACSRADAVNGLQAFIGRDRPHLIGAVPSFDDIRLTLMLAEFGERPRYHYHLVCVEVLAVGWLAGRYREIDSRSQTPQDVPFDPKPPWDSDELSRAIGVDPEQFDRHTAMGDVRWAMAIYDRVMGRA